MKFLVDFSKFNNSWYSIKRNIALKTLWLLTSVIFFESKLFPFYGLKIYLLRLFGAQIGSHCVIKPCVKIKYPWNLNIGNYVWIGEQVWIDNLGQVTIGNNVCISQGVLLITGNHDYKKIGFDLILEQIIVEDGVWLCAKSIVGPGVICKTHSVLCLGSVTNHNLSSYGIYKGNPATKIRERIIV